MSKEKPFPASPKLQRLLLNLGENFRLARLRRQFSASLVSERARDDELGRKLQDAKLSLRQRAPKRSRNRNEK